MKGLLALLLAMIIQYGLLALMNFFYSRWEQHQAIQQKSADEPYLKPKPGTKAVEASQQP